jgi:predicted transcriptional regulator
MTEPRTLHTLEEVLAAIEKGITKTGTAKVLGCSRETVRNYCKRWKTVEDAFKERRGELVDLAEMALRGAVLKQEPWAVTFALRTLGKDEGYTERREITTPKDQPLEVKHSYDLTVLADDEIDQLEDILNKASTNTES